jgi:succinoglycan biosynthesis transport protein ExoP
MMRGTPTPPAETSGAPLAAQHATAREFLTVVFRRKWIIVVMFLVTTATVAFMTLRQKAEFASSGLVLVRRGEQESAMTPTRRITGLWEEELGSEIQIVRSYPVLQLAREALHKSSPRGAKPIEIEPSRVGVEVIGKSSVLSIAYTDPDSAMARRACAAMIDAYIEYRQNDLSLNYPREFFDTEIGNVQKELDHWTEARLDYANRESVVDINEQQRTTIYQLGQLESRRAEISADYEEARTMQQKMEDLQNSTDVDLPTFSQTYSNEGALLELKRRVIEQESRLAQLRERYREDSPTIQNGLETLQSLKDLLKREVEARIQMSHSKVEVLGSRLAVFDQDIARLKSSLETMPSRETQIEEMDRRIALLKERLEGLVKMSDQARVNERTSARTNVFLMAPASDATPTRKLDYVRLALAPAFSVVVGIGLAFFIDGLDLTVRTSGHAETALELPVLAAVGERRRSRVR